MFAGLFELCVASVGHCLPGLDLLGHGEPLHAHVRHSELRWIKPEPQEDRPQPTLGSVSVLPQQGRSSVDCAGVVRVLIR